MTEISTVSGSMARRTSSGSTRPYPSTGTRVTRAPRVSKNRSGSVIAGCSIELMMKCGCGKRWWFAKNTPLSAWLLASVPPDVKMSSVGSQPISEASRIRDNSTTSAAGVPAQGRLDGFPSSSSRILSSSALTNSEMWSGRVVVKINSLAHPRALTVRLAFSFDNFGGEVCFASSLAFSALISSVVLLTGASL